MRASTSRAGIAGIKYTSKKALNLAKYLGFVPNVTSGASKPIIGEVIGSKESMVGDIWLGTLVLTKSETGVFKNNVVETLIGQARVSHWRRQMGLQKRLSCDCWERFLKKPAKILGVFWRQM